MRNLPRRRPGGSRHRRAAIRFYHLSHLDSLASTRKGYFRSLRVGVSAVSVGADRPIVRIGGPRPLGAAWSRARPS
jgi:hypothetical protein